jgi:hypothetical protein
MIEIYYHHVDRKIIDNKGKQYTFKEANKLVLENEINVNVAFIRLQRFNGDMEKVEQSYIEENKN